MAFGWLGNSGSPRRLVTLLGLVALVVGALLAYRDLLGPGRAWRRAIHDADPAARVVAWNRVQRDGEIRGLDREGTIHEVLAALGDPSPETRGWAVSTLPSLKVDPPSSLPRVVALLKDPDEGVRARAAAALGDVLGREAPGRDQAVEAIRTALNDSSGAVRLAAVASLGQVIYQGGESMDPLRSGRGDDPALALAVARLQDPDLAVQVEAASVLANNDRGEEAVPMLIAYLKDQPVDQPPPRSADRAFLALMVLAIHSDPAAAFLGAQIGEHREGHPDRPRDALAWAARQSPEARLRVKRVADGLLDPANPSLRHNAGLLLHEIGSNQPALPVLIEALDDESADIRVRAVEALSDLAVEDATAFAALESAAEGDDTEVGRRASAAVEAIEWAEILSNLEAAP